jgi:hypothetical protein
MRRRRPARDITFSFDSFLDVVANVIGIILRLILVAWVGARSYQAIVVLPEPDPLPLPAPEQLQEPAGPDRIVALQAELARQRQDLQQLQSRLLQQKKEVGRATEERVEAREEQVRLKEKRARLEEQVAHLPPLDSRELARLTQVVEKRRAEKKALEETVQTLKEQQAARKVLRYRTPVSNPLATEELMFELRKGRVTLIDLAVLLDEVERGLRDKEDDLRHTWETTGVTQPAGAFRLRYVVERRRDLLGGLSLDGRPDPNSTFRYGLTSWVVEPVLPERGESASEALRDGSDFRKVVDTLSPEFTAVTLWVYADSFPLYRQLRDYLHQRGMEVAGRPLPDHAPIGASRQGTISRGQ